MFKSNNHTFNKKLLYIPVILLKWSHSGQMFSSINGTIYYVVNRCCYTAQKLKTDFSEEVYRVSQEERTKLRESVPYVKLYRYNPKHLYPKLNGYGDNGKRSLKLCSCYTLTDCQIHIETGRNMWFL